MNPVPTHIAIIMDGNGRWAEMRGFERTEGHRKGIETVDRIVEDATSIGIKYLTLYTFSEENWERPTSEVEALMRMLVEYLGAKRQKMIDNSIRFMVIGDRDRLPKKVLEAVVATEEATAGFDRLTLIVALSYGARGEICRAINNILKSGERDITPEKFASYLDTKNIPDPDLFIRTSGEKRVSNFLLWQIAYAELYFTPVMWPDFNKQELIKAIEDYKKRERRFGKI